MVEVHHATPGAGRRLAFHLMLVLVGGVALLWAAQAYQPVLLQWATADPAQTRVRAQMLIAAAALIVLAPVVGIAIYLWQIAARTIADDRFPPEGLVVIRDMPIVRGAAARSRGRLFKAFAVAMFMAAVVLVVLFWSLAVMTPDASRDFETSPPSQVPRS